MCISIYLYLYLYLYYIYISSHIFQNAACLLKRLLKVLFEGVGFEEPKSILFPLSTVFVVRHPSAGLGIKQEARGCVPFNAAGFSVKSETQNATLVLRP